MFKRISIFCSDEAPPAPLAGPLACLSVFSPSRTFATNSVQTAKSDLTGTWMLDLQASNSLEPLMTQLGAGFLDRKYAARTKLKATLQQTEDALKVATHGQGSALDQILYLDRRSDSSKLQLLGATSVNANTAWSEDYKQLVETHQIRTKKGKVGKLII